MRIAGTVAASLLALAACQSSPTTIDNDVGTLAVSWVGNEQTGQFTAPARAGWCAVDTMLQVLASRGDTGVGLALYVTDTVRPGQHPVIAPGMRVSWRPLGATALRWFGQTQVDGYEATSGVISVTSVDSGATGTLDVRLKKLGSDDTLRLTGTFAGVPILPAEGACGRVNKAPVE